MQILNGAINPLWRINWKIIKSRNVSCLENSRAEVKKRDREEAPESVMEDTVERTRGINYVVDKKE